MMYPAIKSNAIKEDKARAILGDDLIDEVLSINCDFSNRVIDDCYEVAEMSASVDFVDADGIDRVLEVLYLIDADDLNTDDLGSLDYSNYTFVIN